MWVISEECSNNIKNAVSFLNLKSFKIREDKDRNSINIRLSVTNLGEEADELRQRLELELEFMLVRIIKDCDNVKVKVNIYNWEEGYGEML